MTHLQNNARTLPAPELKATMTGTWVLIGTLIAPPHKIVFDNLGSATVTISFDEGATNWKTFAAGSALVLDEDFGTLSQGYRIWGNGASGDFSVAYTYYIL